MNDSKNLKYELEKEIDSIFRLEKLLFQLKENGNLEIYNKKVDRLIQKYKDLFTKIFENKKTTEKISEEQVYEILNIDRTCDINQLINTYEDFLYANNRLNDIEEYLILFNKNFKYPYYIKIHKQIDFYLNQRDLNKITDKEYFNKLIEFKKKYPTEECIYEYIGFYAIEQDDIDYDMLYNLSIEASKYDIFNLDYIYDELICHYKEIKDREKINTIMKIRSKRKNNFNF